MAGRGFGRSSTSNSVGEGAPRSSLSFTTPPPNLSQVTDPKIVVSFKGLLKKNDTTVAKALEEIRSYIRLQREGDPDKFDLDDFGGVICAWAQFYPRISINNSRRVRELAHLVQFEIFLVKPPMIKDYLPMMVPTWLAGTFDRDTAVAQAAKLGWETLLDTPNKIKSVLKLLQSKILAYVQEGLDETPETLSDERTMSHDDLKATYYRLVGKCIDMVSYLINESDDKDVQKHSSKYDALFKNASFLDCTSSDDANLRKSSLRLLGMCALKQSSFIGTNLKAVSGALIGEALGHTQLGSAHDLIETLKFLTVKFPEVWAPTKSKPKKDPVTRLRLFIEKGSQRGSAKYWNSLATLVLIIPDDVLPHKVSAILEFASAIRVGIKSREEPKMNLATAWAAYFKVVFDMTKNHLSDPDSQIKVIKEAILPAVRNFILMEPDQVAWLIETPDTVKPALESCASLRLDGATEQIQAALQQEFKYCAQRLEEGVFASIPVDAIAMKKVEDAIQARFVRWFSILRWIFTSRDLKRYLGGTIPEDDSFIMMTEKLIRLCAKAIEGRQGKGYGATSAMLTCVRASPLIVAEHPSAVEFIREFLAKNLFALLETPSGEYLLATLKSLKACVGQEDTFKHIWTTTLRKVLEMATGDRQQTCLALLLLRGDGAEFAIENTLLQEYVYEGAIEAIMNDDGPSWSVFHAAAASKSISDATATKITDIIVVAFEDDSAIDRGLKALTSLTEKDLSLLVSSMDRRTYLLARLLDLNEDQLGSENADRKLAIKSLTRLLSDAGPTDPKDNPVVCVLETHLAFINDNPLSVHTMVNLARNLFEATDEDNRVATAIALFLAIRKLDRIESFRQMSQPPFLELAMCEHPAGAHFLVEAQQLLVKDVPFDDHGHSVPYRMALYTCEVLHDTLLYLPAPSAAELLFFLCLAQQLVKAQHTSGKKNFMYSLSCDHIDSFDARLQDIFLRIIGNSRDWRRNTNKSANFEINDTTEILSGLINILLYQSKNRGSLGYHSGNALSNLLSTIVSINGLAFEVKEEWLQEQRVFTNDVPSPFISLAILTGLAPALTHSVTINRFCNSLVSVIYGISGPLETSTVAAHGSLPFTHTSTLFDRALLTVVMLNACLHVYDENEMPVQTVRLAKAANQLISWTDGRDFSGGNYAVATEVCKSLTKILPVLKYSSGQHWDQTLQKLCLSPWSAFVANPTVSHYILVSSSLRLYSRLVKLKDDEDATIELRELFKSQHTVLNQGLLSILTVPRPVDTPALATLIGILTQEVLKIPAEQIDPEEIYPLVGSYSAITQATAFELLTKFMPRWMEEMTMNVVVNDKEAELPAELLSLLLSSNVFQERDISSPQADLVDQIQYPRRSVLLAWKLIFDCFGLAPFKVRAELRTKLQEQNELNTLLNFILHTFSVKETKNSMHPLSRFQLDKDLIRKYDVWDVSHSAGMLHSVRWLSAHVYFLALKHVPGLVRSWYLISSNRADKSFMSSWTERHFTPLVIEHCVEEVRAWRGASEAMDTEDGKQLIVKLPAKKGSTITVSYEIDDQQCSVSLAFPETYPLKSLGVASISRVAVPPKSWDQVLRDIEGAVRFSGGNVIDGIEVFRQNVSKFLDGHEPCSICYSIVSEDMRLPEKGCATCRNMFHTKCMAKWFATSNANTCPMCRQPWTGLARR